jgi:hypothetical protein
MLAVEWQTTQNHRVNHREDRQWSRRCPA